MTTIALNEYCIAADTQCSGGHTSNFHKLHIIYGNTKVIPMRFIVGFAGNISYGYKFLDWIKEGFPDHKKPIFEDNFKSIVISQEYKENHEIDFDTTKIDLWETDLVPFELMDKIYSIGSGCYAGKAAMLCGCDPVRAVYISSLIDVDTGGKIEYFRFRGPNADRDIQNYHR